MPPEDSAEKQINDPNVPADSPLKQIRTFQGDVAEALRSQQESLVSIQRREHLKKSGANLSTQAVSERSIRRRNLFMLSISSLLLVALGSAGGWYAYTEFIRKSATPITTAPENRFISSEQELAIQVTDNSREKFIELITGALDGASAGEVKHVILKEGAEAMLGQPTNTLATSKFFDYLETRAPGSLVRAFDPLMMLGAYGESTFLIIKLESFENAFAGMLSWEKDIASDLGPILRTAPALRDITVENVFIDVADRNKDIRELSYMDSTVLVYTFVDNNMLVITDQIETLRAVLDRLNKAKLSR